MRRSEEELDLEFSVHDVLTIASLTWCIIDSAQVEFESPDKAVSPDLLRVEHL